MFLVPSGASAGAALALLAALSWGGGDFAGGMGVKATGGRASGALRVMLAAHSLSLVCLAIWLGLRNAFLWQGPAALWGLGCGVVAGLSIAAFYVALARGTMGLSAAVSGLLAAAIPAAVGMLLEGRPGPIPLLGFGFAALAIWMIAAPVAGSPSEDPGVMTLAIGGGIGFGLYFAGLKFANGVGAVEALALARAGSVATCAVVLLLLRRREKATDRRGPWLPHRALLWSLGVAVLDTGGNLFYIAATRRGRLDIAAVLAALYPASTILLAAAVLHERPGRRQIWGMLVAVFAVILVTL